MLQNRETAESDLSRALDTAPDGISKNLTMQGKVDVALDIFENSTSREYLISLQRFHKAQEGGRRE